MNKTNWAAQVLLEMAANVEKGAQRVVFVNMEKPSPFLMYDEATAYLARNHMSELTDAFRACRRTNAATVVVTQTLDDLTGRPRRGRPVATKEM